MRSIALLLANILCHFSANAVPSIGMIEARGYRAIPGTDGIYLFKETSSTRDDAEAACESDGTTLFFPENEDEFNTVVQYFKRNFVNFPNYFHLGMRRRYGGYVTVNGTHISNVYNKWILGEPNMSGSCVQAWKKAGVWGLDDMPCTNLNTFICKAPVTTDKQCSHFDAVPVPSIDMIEALGYRAIPGTDGIYLFKQTRSTRDNAEAACESDGTTLYFPENENEFNAVIQYFTRTIGNFPTYFHIGIRRLNGGHFTVTGTPISNVYNKWIQGEPNWSGSCVQAWKKAGVWGLDDMPCSNLNTFICKATVKNDKQCSYVDDVPVPSVDMIEALGYRVIPGTDGIYLFNGKRSTRDDAEAACESDGTTLFFPENEDEFNTVVQYFKRNFVNFPNYFQLGMRISNGRYVTVNGIHISNVYNKWIQGEPDSSGSCVAAWKKAGVWGLDDTPCTNLNMFICKAPVKIDRQCSHYGYKYSEPLGKCYKLQLTPKNWAEARIVCQEEDSDLAVINSHEEAAHLVWLANKITQKIACVPGNFKRGVFLLGFHKEHVEDWQIVQGNSLNNSGYSCWGFGQPSGGDDNKCGSMFYNGQLNAIGCDREAFFICERHS